MTKYEDTDARWRQDIERRLRALETGPRAPFTSIPDEAGNEVVRLSREGLTIVDGAIWVGGGPVRAIDMAYDEGHDQNITLSTVSMTEAAVVTVTPPAWATTVVATSFVLFQMTNTSGAVQQIWFRAAVNGVPSSGGYSESLQPADVANVVDQFQATLTRGVDFTSSFTCSGFIGIDVGANAANVIRSKISLVYLR